MSSPTLDQIQTAIKQALDSIDGLRASATEVEDAPGANAPIAYPRVVDWQYDTTFRSDDETIPTLWHFDIWVLVSLASGSNRAQTQLNAFIAPTGRRSFKATLEEDERLGGCVDYIRLTGGGVYGYVDVASTRVLAASMRAEVHA